MQYFLTSCPANRLKELVAQLGLLQTVDELMSDYVGREEELVKVPRAEKKAMTVDYLAALDERTLLLTAKGVRTRGHVGRVEPPRHG